MMLNIIHDIRRLDRFVMLQQELAEQEITEYKIWDAIIETPAKKGCSRSHKRIIQWAKDNNETEVIIGEDDMHFGRHEKIIKGAYKFFLDNKPKEFSIYLAGVYDGKIESDNSIKTFTSTTLYICHNSFYDKFLSANENNNIDWWISKFGGGKYFVCNPMVVRQHDTVSAHNSFINHDSHLRKYKFFES